MAASVGKSRSGRRRSGLWLRASANRAPPHGGGASRALFPLRATTTAADSERECASSKPKQNCSKPKINSVGPSKYELQGPTD